MKKIFILTGEPSGDKLASTVVTKLQQDHSDIEYLSVGGSHLNNLGIKSIYDLKEITYIGFTSVILNLFKIRNKINETVKKIIEFNPDILLSVDSPDFTLRVAEKVKNINPNIKTIHYVAPQVWVWREGRVKNFKKFLDHILLLFNFEKKYFDKENIKNTLISNRNVITVTPVIVDPDYIFVTLRGKIYYNPAMTTKTANQLLDIVKQTVYSYTNMELNTYRSVLRKSKLARSIDDADASILNNDTSVELQKIIVPTLDTANSFVLNYNNKILQEIPQSTGTFVDGSAPVRSTSFTFNSLTDCSLRDNGTGTLQVIKQSNGTMQVVNTNIGTVDYDNGVVNINGLKVSSYTGAGITVTANPVDTTIKSDKNIILRYNNDPLINIIQERV